jgi:hypothetical protein
LKNIKMVEAARTEAQNIVASGTQLSPRKKTVVHFE